MQMDRHHLLEIILWPNGDGTFRKIINTEERLKELGIYDDFKMTITIPANVHSTMHSHNRPDGYWDRVSQSMSIAKTGEKNAMYGKKHSAETKEKMSKAQLGHFVSDESKEKMSSIKKGRHWFNNGIRSVLTYKCPPGFKHGRIVK